MYREREINIYIYIYYKLCYIFKINLTPSTQPISNILVFCIFYTNLHFYTFNPFSFENLFFFAFFNATISFFTFFVRFDTEPPNRHPGSTVSTSLFIEQILVFNKT